MPETEITFVEDEASGSQPIEEGPEFESTTDSAEEVDWKAKAEEASEQLEIEKRRRAATQRDWQEQQRALGYYEGALEALAQDLDEREAYNDAMARAEPPQVEDWEEVLTDGDKLRQVIQERDQYIVGNILSQLEPVAARTSQHDSLIGRVIHRAQKDAYSEADEMLREEYEDYAPGDMAKEWDAMNATLNRSPNHQELRMDPEALVHAYSAIRRHRKRGQPKPVKAQAHAPVGVRPGQQPSRDGALPPIPAQFRTMAMKLGRDPGKLWKRHVESGGRI